MKTINKNSYTKIYWKIFKGNNKVSEDFHSLNTELRVFVVGTGNKYYIVPIINRVIEPGYDVIEVDIPSGMLEEGAYDLRAIWWKNKGRDLLTSNRCGIFGITDSIEEAPIEDLAEIKIVSYTENFGRDGMSAYETAVMYDLHLGITSEKEWVMQETIRMENENARKDAEEVRIAAEISRKNNENSRVSAEEARESKEYIRESNELVRISNESSRQSAEGLRKSNEEDREASEQERYTNERCRIQSEKARMSAESARVASEGARDAAESKRKETESSRETAEAQRVSVFNVNEEQRKKGETSREAAEAQRVEDESARVEAEKGRRAAEAKRQATFTANEESRQSAFDTNEEARQSVFNANEEKREEADALREERTDEAIASIANKVDRTDNAPELTSGFAGNLVGRGEATSEEIGLRPSGGLTSVNDGAARIERLKGNTLAWNQRFDAKFTSITENGLTVTNNSDGTITVNGTNTGSSSVIVTIGRVNLYQQGHKMLLIGSDKMQGWTKFTIYDSNVGGDTAVGGTGYTIYTTTSSLVTSLAVWAGISVDNVTFRPLLYDLTQMFGAGNEPTTIEEFNARKPLGVSDAYNEGELISTTADEIKSVGFNAWDEEWEQGGFTLDGVIMPDITRIRTKNPIRVIPSARYNIESGGKTIGFRFYDKDDNHLGTFSNYNATGGTMTIPNNAYYMRFSVVDTATYNHDICIHLVHTGYRNGEYEPYEEFRRSLPISEIKDSEGNALFPNGLLSAGSVYDEITATKAIKRIGVVDMGTLNWHTAEARPSIALAKVEGKVFGANILTARYTAVRTDFVFDEFESYANMTIRGHSTNNNVYVKDDSFEADKDKITTTLNGILLYYELAEPIEVDLPEPINMDYEVSDFGTEEVISDTPTTPLKADIIYQFNAVDRIRENSANIKKIEEKLGDISVDLLTPITYSSLKALRDGGSLVKGMWYRITDYVTTTKQSETKSANHPFDVIVLATSESELSHIARAIAHDGDTYFDGNDLGAWELWYDLDNDTTKYEWADATNGKGVIYRMIDEKRNDCPYDFKNTLFYNDKYTSDTTSDKYYYTFSYVVKNVLYDGTVEKQVANCYGNSMGMYINSKKRSLNKNVWRNTSFGNRCYSNTFGRNCCYSTFGHNCHSNTFGNDCNNIIFGGACYSNTFGRNCDNITFGHDCYSNTFGNDCRSNTFGNNCDSDTIGNSFEFNTFGNDCRSNTFGNGFSYNIFGNGCSYNTFGHDCNYSTFGNNFEFNTFGDGGSTNTFGDGCSYNTFGNSYYACGFYNSSEFDYKAFEDEYVGTGTPINNVTNCRFGEGCSHLLIHTTNGVRNLFVSQNLCSLTENEEGYILPEVIEVDEYGDYELKIARNRNGEIKVYCEADLV